MNNPQPFLPSIDTVETAPSKKMSRDEINALPLFYYSGKITIVKTRQDLDYACKTLSGETVLGVDTETKPNFRKGTTYDPSLIQLATADEVFLFPLRTLPLDNELSNIFECPAIIKTGVAVPDDLRLLTKLWPFKAKNVIDLSDIAKKNRIVNRGLRGLAAVFLGIRISKSEQCSNWGTQELSPRQIRYAATDAWAGRALYLSMQDAGLLF